MDAGSGSFVEQSVFNYANLSYNLQKYGEAFSAYRTLYSPSDPFLL